VNRKFFIVIALVLVAAAGLAAHAVTQGHNGRYGRHDGWMLRHMIRELSLTEAQQAQIKSIWEAEKAKIQPLRRQLRQNEQAESASIRQTFDEIEARAFAGKQAQIMSDLIVEKQRAKSAIYAVLTPDQRAKAAQLLQERQQRWQKHTQKFSPQQPQSQ